MSALPESTGRVCCANNLLGGLTHRWPTKPPSSWGQSCALWGLDPCFVSLRLRLLAVSALPSTLGPVGKMAKMRRPGQKKTSWLGWHPDGHPNGPGPGCRPMPVGLRPLRCWPRIMFMYLSLSDVSRVRNQDGDEPLLTGGRPSSEVASVHQKVPHNHSCLPPGWSAKVSGRWRRA